MEPVAGTEEKVVEKTPEQVKADEAEAEAAFAQGVANTTGKEPEKVAGTDDAGDKDKPKGDEAAKATADAEAKAKSDAEAKAKADAEAAASVDEWAGVSPVVRKNIEGLTGSVNKIAGHIGSFKQALETLTTTAKAAAEKKDVAAPTKVEIAEALANPDKWKQLQEDFPEWMTPIAAELTQLRKDVSAFAKLANERADQPPPKQEQVQAEPIDRAGIIAEAEERAVVRMKHPDWKTICASPAFAKKDANGALVGGWLATAPADIKEKAGSDNADDAIAVFDAYKAHEKKLADEAAEKLKKTKRLEGAVVVKGSQDPPQQGISDEAAFELGVKRVRGGSKK